MSLVSELSHSCSVHVCLVCNLHVRYLAENFSRHHAEITRLLGQGELPLLLPADTAVSYRHFVQLLNNCNNRDTQGMCSTLSTPMSLC